MAIAMPHGHGHGHGLGLGLGLGLDFRPTFFVFFQLFLFDLTVKDLVQTGYGKVLKNWFRVILRSLLITFFAGREMVRNGRGWPSGVPGPGKMAGVPGSEATEVTGGSGGRTPPREIIHGGGMICPNWGGNHPRLR